jgi:hypothetical protein
MEGSGSTVNQISLRLEAPGIEPVDVPTTIVVSGDAVEIDLPSARMYFSRTAMLSALGVAPQ